MTSSERTLLVPTILLLGATAVFCVFNAVRLIFPSRFSFSRWISLPGASYLLTVLTSLFFLSMFGNIAHDRNQQQTRIDSIGTPVIQFTALDGREVDLAALRGKVVLVDFWATWCGPCRAAMPKVIQAYEKFGERGFEIIGISLDDRKEALERYVREQGITWPQHFDGNGFNNRFAVEFGIKAVPTMWLIDRSGKLHNVVDADDLDRLLKQYFPD